jgi:hypothetical protein
MGNGIRIQWCFNIPYSCVKSIVGGSKNRSSGVPQSFGLGTSSLSLHIQRNMISSIRHLHMLAEAGSESQSNAPHDADNFSSLLSQGDCTHSFSHTPFQRKNQTRPVTRPTRASSHSGTSQGLHWTRGIFNRRLSIRRPGALRLYLTTPSRRSL